MVINVGIGECAISNNTEDTIITYALASCVAVTAYSPLRRAAGMVHIVLPSPASGGSGSRMPFYYADTGVPLMINRLCSKYACLKGDLTIRLFGGAESINEADVFKLGERNIQAVERLLKEMKLSFDSTETGGVLSKTLEMDVATGKITIKTQPITI